MKKTTPLALVAGLMLAVTPSPARANWVHFADSIFDAQGETEKHPAKIVRIITLPTDAVGVLVEACLGYVSFFEKPNEGKLTATATVFDKNGDQIERVKFSGRASGGVYGECKEISELEKDSSVVFEVRFKQFGRVRNADRFQVGMALAIDGANPFARQAPPLSDADQRGIVKMAEWAGSGRGVALRREGSGWTVDWRVPGEAFELGRTFRTIAEAISAWCSAIGE